MGWQCSKCGIALAGKEFCGDCGGAAREVVERAEAVAEYESILSDFASDGVLEGWELDELGRLREELGVSAATHARLIAKHQPVTEKLPLALEVDESTLTGFREGSRGVIRARLRNTGERPVRNVVVRHAVSGEDAVHEQTVRILGPGREEEFALMVFLEEAGQYAMETVVRAEDMRGKGQCYRSPPLAFAVGDARGSGPQSVNVSVDASSMRVTGDPLVNLAGMGSSVRGGALGERAWRDLHLRLMTPSEWEEWALARDGATRAKAEAEARAKVEAERAAQAQAEAAAREAAERATRLRIEAEARARAEADAREKARAKAEAEARAKADVEARAKADVEAKARAAEPAWKQGWMLRCGQDGQGSWALTRIGTEEVKFRWCPPGRFQMGSPSNEEGRFGNETQHQVELTKGFWLAEHPVTQGVWESVMGSNPSLFKGRTLPVEKVSWHDVQGFLSRVNGASPVLSVRLPTEAEWEYGCRAGTPGARYGMLDAVVWYKGNSGGQTHPVGGKTPNAWGLYDMLGNVWEWCSDWFADYPTGRVVDPTGPASGSLRVRRGGSWNGDARYARAASRDALGPERQGDNLGFRLARGQ
jgi:sulfatase modifying factor 1